MKRSGVLAERDFLLVLVAWGLSALGDFLAVTALTLRVEEQSGSGFAVAGLLFAAAVPQVVFNPVAGWLVDRFETRRVLALAALAQALVVGALAAWDGLAITYALVFVLHCGLTVERPALFTLIPRIVGERQAPVAYGWFESVKYATVTLGLLLGGVLTGAFGAASALLVDAATFLVTAAVALALHVSRRPSSRAEEQGPATITAGLRLVGRDGLLRVLVLVLAGSILFGGIDNVANVFFAKDALGIGDAGYGALAAAWGAGMIAGAVLAGRRVRAPDAAVVIVVAVTVMAAAILATAPAPVVWTALVTLAVGGVGNGLANVAMRVLLQARVEEALRGRVYAAYQGVLSVADFSALAIGGALIQLIGARWTLALAGGGCLAVGLSGLPAVRRSDRNPATLRAVDQ